MPDDDEYEDESQDDQLEGKFENDSAEGAENDSAEGAEMRTALPPRLESWRKRSATGAILTGIAFGLQQVFDPKETDPVVAEAPSDPIDPGPFELHLDPDHPERSTARLRPPAKPADQVTPDPSEQKPSGTGPE